MFRFSSFTLVWGICIALGIAACSDHSKTKKSTEKEQEKTLPRLANSYSNPPYDVSLKYPESWLVLEEPHLEVGQFAIEVFKRGTGAEKEMPLDVHGSPRDAYVAIWPHGLGTELPSGQSAKLDSLKEQPDFGFPINTEKSEALLLKNGGAWAYFLVPEHPPQKWDEVGFIFAKMGIANSSVKCYKQDTGKEIPQEQCDALEGDRVVREGKIIGDDQTYIFSILQSLSLTNVKQPKRASDMIDLKKPLSNMDIISPLKIKGQAKGSWYFEGQFSVTLKDAQDNVLAESSAKAQGTWMTDDFVPFEATLTFDVPDDERGHLILHKANPSGKAENDRSYSIPVIFPPKKN